MIRCFFLIACFSIASGCATVDVTQDPRLDHLVNQCFELQQDSFVYTRSCLSKYGWEVCESIQLPAQQCLPSSYEEYLSNTDYYTTEMRECLGRTSIGVGNRRSVVKGYLEAGEEIKISKVIKGRVGVQVLCWVTKATIETGEHTGLEVELPSCTYHQRPMWIEPVAVNFGIPQVKPEFLEPCEASE